MSEEAKQFLRGYQRAKRDYMILKAQLREIEELINSISVDYSKERVQSSGVTDISSQIVKMADLRTECIASACKAGEQMRRVCTAIWKVENRVQRVVLYKRYIAGKRWEEISVEMHYSYRSVLKIHQKAVAKIAEIIKEGT